MFHVLLPKLSWILHDIHFVSVACSDASQIGLGVWLRQKDGNSSEQVVATASRSLTDTERRYSNIKRECLAVVLGFEKFEYKLLEREVVVETDYTRKTLLKHQPDFYWFLFRCLNFDITIKYKLRKSMLVTDVSRVGFKEEVAVKHDIHFITT